MKTLAIALCLVVSALCLAQASPLADEWVSYKAKFGKTYETEAEDKLRFAIYKESKRYVEEHNAGKHTYTVGINKFSDMLPEEFEVYKGYKQTERNKNTPIYQYDPTKVLAVDVDWRTSGAVTPVKDQGQCGSCWAFSTTGSLESQTFLKKGNLPSLSEQNLVDCVKLNSGCGGGWMDYAFNYIKNNGGIDTEASYPYEAVDRPCRYDPNNIGATCTGYVDLPYGDENALASASASVGPIAVAIDASHPSFQIYSSGIYSSINCNPDFLDHAVLVVGYGSDANGDYWIVKNSWGTGWGMSGYINMARNAGNMCGIASAASYPTV